LSSRLLSRNAKVKIYKTIILSIVLYGCENRVLRRIFGSKRDEVTGEWRKLHSEELHSLYSSSDIIRQVKANEVCGAWEWREKCTRFWWESLKERDHLEDQGVGGKMESEWILGRLAWGLWIGFDWLRTRTGGKLLWVR
jgi:hypothetical protein